MCAPTWVGNRKTGTHPPRCVQRGDMREFDRRGWPEPPRTLWGEVCDILGTWIEVTFAAAGIGVAVAIMLVGLLWAILVALAPYIVATAVLLWLIGVL